VLCFSVGLALLTGIIFGIWPALQSARPDVSQVMQANTRRMTAGIHGRRTHNALIASQIALTLLLLAGAGAAMHGFVKMMNVRLGYDPHNVMSVGIPVHENSYTTWESRKVYFQQLVERVREVPEVESAGISSNATPPNNGWDVRFEISGRPAGAEQRLRMNFVDPEYFVVLRIPLLHGRIWYESEARNGAKLALINETMARQYFPNGDAIGSMIRIPEMKGEPPFVLAADESDGLIQVVGIVGDSRDDGMRKPVLPEAYVPYTLVMPMYTQMLVRTKVPPLTVLRAIREKIHQADADQQVARNVRDLDRWITTQPEWEQSHLVTTLFAGFAILALALAAIGLYSVISYAVAQRTGEFGIRMALGAAREDVLLMVFRSAVVSVGGGVVAGLALTMALNRVLTRLIQGSALDVLVLAAVVLLLVTTASLSCFVPARRASSIDPVVALRYE
jgi:predicted permease